MKCSKCGRNFGNGMNCQYCGVDRVTGLANYGGYDNPRQGYESDNGGYGSPSTMVCYACGNIIPAKSEYCPFCSRELYVTCPQCGNIYSSQYPVCYKCGTNREKYFKQKEEEKQDAIRKERERERKQKEWEQSQEGKEELGRRRKEKENKETIGITLAHIIFWGGGTALLFWLHGLIDENWLSQEIPILGGNLRNIVIVCISYGASFLAAGIVLEIIDEEE